MDQAVARGYFDIIQFLYRSGLEHISQSAIENAAMSNHKEIVEWMHQITSESIVTADLVGRTGRFFMVKWCMEKGYEEFIPSAMNGAAAAGPIEIVQYLYSLREEQCSIQAICKAAEKGHLEIIICVMKYESKHVGYLTMR